MSSFAPMTREKLSDLATAFGDNRVHAAATALHYLDRAEMAERALATSSMVNVQMGDALMAGASGSDEGVALTISGRLCMFRGTAEDCDALAEFVAGGTAENARLRAREARLVEQLKDWRLDHSCENGREDNNDLCRKVCQICDRARATDTILSEIEADHG